MWISKADYTTLVDRCARAETRADWLLTQVNLLNQQLGEVKFNQTGQATAIPIFHKEATPPVTKTPEDSFEDMGDDAAHVEGVSWDDFGRVKFTGN